jgi:hypothetical protein
LRIILHIGTHKTGTSSIQNFCANHIDFLRKYGVYYAFDPYKSGRNANFLGTYLSRKNYKEIEEFFSFAIKTAQDLELERLLISAETLYAITSFYSDSNNDLENCKFDKCYINALSRILSGHDVIVVCYLRHQIDFCDSLYNQMVKHRDGYKGRIEEFINDYNGTFDYYHHLEAWSESFGDKAIKVRLCGNIKDSVSDFLSVILGISEYPIDENNHYGVNLRLTRGVLEFKRNLNKKKMSAVRGFYAYKAVEEISSVLGGSIESELTDTHKSFLVNRYDIYNQRLCTRWTSTSAIKFLSPSPNKALGKSKDSLKENREIEQMYNHIMRRPSVILKIFTRSFFRFLSTNVSGFKFIAKYARLSIYRNRVKKGL